MKSFHIPGHTLFTTLKSFWFDAPNAWANETTHPTATTELKKKVLFPMIIICVICTTLGKYITEQRIEAAIIWGIVEGCLMLASYHICVYICKKERNTRQEHIDDDTCNKIVLFPFTIVLGVNTVHSLLTSWFFLYLLLGVVFYEVWIAANSYLKINNQTKDSFFFTNSIAIIITPAIMESITHKILVNL